MDQNYFGLNFFWTKDFFIQIFLTQNLFGPEFLDPKVFVLIFFLTKFCLTKKNFGPTIFLTHTRAHKSIKNCPTLLSFPNFTNIASLTVGKGFLVSRLVTAKTVILMKSDLQAMHEVFLFTR